MALSYKQAKLVQGTLPALRKHGERIASLFYATMLQEHPELRDAFNSANQQSGRQPRALTTIIIAFAANLSHTSELIPQLERICQKHCSLGIQPEQYAIVGEYLIRAFRSVLGPDMTPEVQAAWTDAYCVLARMMIGREAHLYRSFASWQTWRRLRVAKKVAEADDVFSFYLEPMDDEDDSSSSLSSSGSSSDHRRSSVSSSSSRYSNFTTRLRTNNVNILKNKVLDNNSSRSLAHSHRPNSLPFYFPGQYISVRMVVPEEDDGSEDSSSRGGGGGGVGSDDTTDCGRSSCCGSQRPHGHYQARQYSLSDRWRPGGPYRISVKRDKGTRFANAVAASFFHAGAVSNALIDQVDVGATLEVSHPAGVFFLHIDPELVDHGGVPSPLGMHPPLSVPRQSAAADPLGRQAPPLVLISAGIGAAPMIAIAHSVAEAQPQRPVTYVHGTRYAPAVFAKEIRALQQRQGADGALRTAYFYSSAAAAAAAAPVSEDSSCLSFAGHVDLRRLVKHSTPASRDSDDSTNTAASTDSGAAAVLPPPHVDASGDLLFLHNSSTEYYVCGPEPFMLDIAMHLVDGLGVNRQRIRYEVFTTGELEAPRRDDRLKGFLTV